MFRPSSSAHKFSISVTAFILLIFPSLIFAQLAGDLNSDGVVNIDDVILVASHFGQTQSHPNWDERADANDDGAVNNADLSIVIKSFAREASDTDLSLNVSKQTVTIGETFTVQANLKNAGSFASWQSWVGFTTGLMSLQSQNTGTFSNFIPDTRGSSTINSTGEIRSGGFSLADSNIGDGSLGVYTFRADSPGQATISTENKSNNNVFGNVLSEVSGYEIFPNILTTDINITIWPENTAPQVSAGPDKSIRLPNTATLNGTVTDDGLPEPPGATTILWSKVSGPGNVTFNPANSAITTASFSVEGNYVLRLTGNDGEYVATDDVAVTVNPIPELYFVLPESITVEIGDSAQIPITITSRGLDLTSLVLSHIGNAAEVFSNSLFSDDP